MADNLAYMVSPGLVPKILGKIAEARRPERFTQDFLEVKLGFGSGSARPIIPLLKRGGFLSSDGTPTKLYDAFRNAGSAGVAMAEGMKIGYKEIFDRSEYAYEMSREKLQALVVEMTGLEKDNRVAQSIVATFLALKEFANFEVKTESGRDSVPVKLDPSPTHDQHPSPPDAQCTKSQNKWSCGLDTRSILIYLRPQIPMSSTLSSAHSRKIC